MVKNGNPRKINYADKHLTKKQQDIWYYKDPVYPIYPTEKNLDMLKYIVANSSNPDSVVLDCFVAQVQRYMPPRRWDDNGLALTNRKLPSMLQKTYWATEFV